MIAGIGGACYAAGELAHNHPGVFEIGRQCADMAQRVSYLPLLSGGVFAIGYGAKIAILKCRQLRR